ncbi:TPA: hypothetical protein ACXN34_001560 [Burkholderia cepacia]
MEAALTDELFVDFLEGAPLYAEVRFSVPGIGVAMVRAGEINDFCSACDERRPFHNVNESLFQFDPFYSDSVSATWAKFECVSCKSESREVIFRGDFRDGCLVIQKFGEWPRKKVKRDRGVQKFLKNDLENFEKAAVCLSNGYGVAAFAYYRRVVEGNIDRLLDLVREDAIASGQGDDILKAIDELKDSAAPMSKKIETANRALPAHLKPDGLNPLGKLYKALSEGVHALPDEECLKKADVLAKCLAFLIGELASRKVHREEFRKQIGDL